jgi:hypothetical protein
LRPLTKQFKYAEGNLEVKPYTKSADLYTVRWHTFTCTLGWPVVGIFSAGADGRCVLFVTVV